MGGAVTTNPWLVALINMTIVFGVLGALGLCIILISKIDPTAKKETKPAPVVAAPAAPAAVEEVVEDNSAIIAVIAAAVAAYGYSASQIACVRRLDQHGWAQNARVDAVNTRNQMF